MSPADFDSVTDAKAAISSLPVDLPAHLPVVESCLRNQRPILDVLGRYLPDDALVLELASGNGQHAAFMTKHLSGVTWQATELAENLANIEAWRTYANNPNFCSPKELDVEQDIWPACQPNAVFISNFVHFVNWKKIHSMLAGVQRLLPQEGLLIIYGPFNYDGQYTSEGNLTLDEWLRSRDPDSGIKDFEQLMLIARQYGLFLTADEDMPANNRTLVFTKLDVA